jgi:hypothetical protein
MPDHRSCPRWQVNWQASLRLEGSQESSSCVLRDINFKGARIHSEQKFAQDTCLKLNLCLTQDCSLEIEAWVCWHKTMEGMNVYGLYFTKIRESDKEKISQFMWNNFRSQMAKQIWEGVSEKEEGGDQVQEDRRIFERFPVTFPLRFLDLKKSKEGQAKTRDISAKGVGFLTNEKLLPQTYLEMWIEIPERAEPLYTRAEVVWSTAQGANEYRVGVNLEKAELMGLARQK